jgi:hypothetical protein
MRIQRALLPAAASVVVACGDARVATEPEPVDVPPCELSLQVGQTATPSSGAPGCRLRAAAGAEYALAVLDPRAIRSAETAAERSFSSYTVSVSLGGTAPSLAARGADAVSAVPPNLHQVVSAVASMDGMQPYERSGPWTLGEQFMVQHPRTNVPAAARVVRVYPDGLVAAWLEGDAAESLEAFLDQLDYAVGVLRQHAIPLLQSAFASRLPVTSTAANQYLMLLGVINERGRVAAVGQGDAVLSWMSLHVATDAGQTSLASLLAHELTHSYQLMYMRDSRPAGVTSSAAGSTFWAVEGGANLISFEVIRRMLGMPVDGNVDLRSLPGTPAAQFYALRAQPGSGEFTMGYDNATGFLRHLVVQRVRAGDGIDEAVRQVSRGAIEGWHGYDQYSGRRQGLTARMRERLGTQWDPIDAMLDWTLGYTADDLTNNTTYQDHAFLRVWDIPESQVVGWRPALTLSATGLRTGGLQRAGGSPDYILLRDAGDGVGFTITSSEPSLQWKLIRRR